MEPLNPTRSKVVQRSQAVPMALLFLFIFFGSLGVTPQVHGDVNSEKKRLSAAIRGDKFDPASVAVDRLIKIGTPKAIDALVSVGLGGDHYGIERYIGSKLVGLPAGDAFERVCELATEDRRTNPFVTRPGPDTLSCLRLREILMVVCRRSDVQLQIASSAIDGT